MEGVHKASWTTETDWPDGGADTGTALCLQGVVTDVQLKRAGPGRPFVVVKIAPPTPEKPRYFQDGKRPVIPPFPRAT